MLTGTRYLFFHYLLADEEKLLNKKILGKNDLILIIFLLIMTSVVGVIIFFTKHEGKQVVVSVDGVVTDIYSIEDDGTYEIQGYDGGRNILVIADGVAYMSEASCPDHLCMGMGRISNVGQSIICLPNRVIIEIRDEKTVESEYDTVS